MDNKKRRGCNYTVSEKDTLLELIKKYQLIIENKETNAHIILKKRQAWDRVCNEFNAVAVSGVRTWQQLRHLYENLKQRSKKNVAKENRLQYNERTKRAQKKASLDKKEITSTGGGSYKSILTPQDAQILAMVAPQVQPLQNPFDDATFYFGDTELISEDMQTVLTVNDVNQDDRSNMDNHQTLSANNFMEQNSDTPHTITSNTKDNHQTPSANNYVEQNIDKPHTITSNIKEQQKTKWKSHETTKQQYFKAKLRNAKLENKYLINKNKMEINKYKLEMQILKLKLKRSQASTQKKNYFM